MVATKVIGKIEKISGFKISFNASGRKITLEAQYSLIIDKALQLEYLLGNVEISVQKGLIINIDLIEG
jgi:hypothetical protein